MPIGTGAVTSTSALGAGTHRIILIAHDDKGQASGAAVCVQLADGMAVTEGPAPTCDTGPIIDPSTGREVGSGSMPPPLPPAGGCCGRSGGPSQAADALPLLLLSGVMSYRQLRQRRRSRR